MTKDKDAQLTIRNLNNLSTEDHKFLVKWLKKVAAQVESRREVYSPVANWSLMK